MAFFSRKSNRPPSDSELHQRIIQGRSDASAAYEMLVLERYRSVVMGAKASVERRYHMRLPEGQVISELYLHLCGKDQQWKNLKSWDGQRNFSTWLWVVTKNLCSKLARRETDQQSPMQPDTEERQQRREMEHAMNASVVARWDTVLSLQRALEELGSPCAHILRLKYYHDMTDVHIGRELQKTREWANRQRRQCLDRLATLFRSQGLTLSDFDIFRTA